MGSFFDRMFKPQLADLPQQDARDQAKLSFLSSQLDTNLFNLCLTKINGISGDEQLLAQFLAYQELAVSAVETLPIADEISCLEQYVSLFQRASETPVIVNWHKNIVNESLIVPRFILFPLVQNALFQGYHRAEKYPMKIKIGVFDQLISLDITNHVHHNSNDQKENELLMYYEARLKHEFVNQHSMILNSNAHTFRSNLILKF